MALSGPAIEICTFGVADVSEKLMSAPYGEPSPWTWASGSLSRPSAVARKLAPQMDGGSAAEGQ